MGWRYVIIRSHCKLSYKNDYMMVHKDVCHRIHLSEIHTVLIEHTDVTITAYLISKFMEFKINLIFCDEQYDPQGQVVNFYGAHDTSKKFISQIHWQEEIKNKVWTAIVEQKIRNQRQLLRYLKLDSYNELDKNLEKIKINDSTNQEAQAAKIYFKSLFGQNFTREDIIDINHALNYGYTILLGIVNREVVKQGYCTQLGVHHCGPFNYFNLSCDLMEPFRPLVDRYVFFHQEEPFDHKYKRALVQIFNEKIQLSQGEYYINNAIQKYITSIFKALDMQELKEIIKFELV